MSTHDSHQAFRAIVERQIEAFPRNALVERVLAGTATMRHYHDILRTLFHQTYAGPYSFARAAVNCDWRHGDAKEYLLEHANEERTHWRWVLDDLAATGYEGESPRDCPPHPTCAAFIGLQSQFAHEFPVGRLAIAAVLEGIGSVHGSGYGARLLGALGLERRQASFFLSHGETDRVHIVELSEVISGLSLTAREWRWMCFAADAAGQFYRAMYDHEAFRV